MKMKKCSAVLGLLSAIALAAHLGYTAYAYLAFFYNPTLKLLTSIPLIVLTCLHAFLGMSSVFLLDDGTRALTYSGANRATIIQRCCAALFFPLLLLHLNTFALLRETAAGGRWVFFTLLLLSQPLFYAVALTHTSVSVTRALITLGLLANRKRQKIIDRVLYILCGILFALAVYAVLKGELALFLQGT